MLVAVLANFDFGNVSEVRTWVSPIRLGYFEFVKIVGKAMISVFTKKRSKPWYKAWIFVSDFTLSDN